MDDQDANGGSGPGDTSTSAGEKVMGTLSSSALERLVARSSNIITVLGADGSLRFSSGGALSTLGIHVGIEPGADAFSVVHPDELAAAHASFDDLLLGKIGREKPLEFRIRSKDGAWHYMEAFAESHFDDPEIAGMVIYSHDVTERHQWTEERERLLDELRARAAELADNARRRDELVAAIAHELRTPVTALSGFFELLADELGAGGPEEGSKVEEYLRLTDGALRRLVRLTGDLEFLGSDGQHELELRLAPLDVAAIAHRSTDGARRSAAAMGIDLRTSIQAGPTLVGDDDRIGQVIDNLLSNAIKFTPRGGRVVLVVEPTEVGWLIECQDSGIGVPEGEADYLLDRYFRASNVRTGDVSGTGIGLSVVKTIVDGHGGTIGVRSKEGDGTTVTVRLANPTG